MTEPSNLQPQRLLRASRGAALSRAIDLELGAVLGTSLMAGTVDAQQRAGSFESAHKPNRAGLRSTMISRGSVE